MKLIIVFASCFVYVTPPAYGADIVAAFTIKGSAEMTFRAILFPKECLAEEDGELKQIDCPTVTVESIPLVMGPPLMLAAGEHTFDLLKGIHEYSIEVGIEEYSIDAYGGVCAFLQQKPKKALVKCGPIGGVVQF